MSKRTLIIAEAGVNHNGSLDLAKELVRVAADCGADFVKFQTFKADELVSEEAKMAEYQKANLNIQESSQLEMLRKLELSYDDFKELKEECQRAGIGFMSTPFDLQSVDFLSSLGQIFWKIPSGEITNLPLLRKIGSLNGKIILSTGMSSMQEVEDAVKIIEQAGTPRSHIFLLHCTTQYPAPYSSVNLRAMNTLESLGCGGVGYSDHTEGIGIPVAAVGMGAEIIEKHFTLDRSLPGPDHKASLEPAELKEMIRQIRSVEQALGDGEKKVSEAELPNIPVARKSIVAARAIKKGELFSEENLSTRRPGTGLSPMLLDTIIGTPSDRDYPPGAQITLNQS